MKYGKSIVGAGVGVALFLTGCGNSEIQLVPELVEPVIEMVQEEEPETDKMVINIYDGVVVPSQTEYGVRNYGTVGEICVRVGDQVSAGDLLLSLSSDSLLKEYNDLLAEKEKIERDLSNLDSRIYGGTWTEKEVNALIAEQKSRDLREKLSEVENSMNYVNYQIEANKVYATEDGVVAGIAVKKNDTVDFGQKVIVTYSDKEILVVSSIVSLSELEAADHIYVKNGEAQYEVNFVQNSSKYSYFTCPEGMNPGDDADIAVILNGDTVLTQESYQNTAKAETVYTKTDKITVNNRYGGELKFITFLTGTRVDIKAGDPIALYYEKIDEMVIKEYELERDYLVNIGASAEAQKMEEYIEELKKAAEATMITAPYDGVCVSFDNYYAEKDIDNYARIAKFSPSEGRMLSVTDTSGKFKYGQRVSVKGKVDGNDFIGYGTVVSVSKYDLSTEYNEGKALVVLDKDSEALYNSYNVYVTSENLQFKK